MLPAIFSKESKIIVKQTFQLTFMVSLLLFSSFAFSQCPDQASASSTNDKCVFMAWNTPPSPLPGSLMEGGDNHTLNGGAGTLASPAEYLKDGAPNCGGSSGTPYDGSIEIDGNTCTYVAGALAAGALPVTLTSFEAIATKEEIYLKWETASEEQNAGFEIQKSQNGIDWQSIGWLEGQGTTNLLNQYSFSDRLPFAGLNYYRLKQMDFDGGFEDSYVVSVDFSNSNDDKSIIAPNPAMESFQFKNLDMKSVNSILLTDHVGRIINNNLKGSQSISVAHLSDGLYFVIIEFENSTKIIKKLNVLR